MVPTETPVVDLVYLLAAALFIGGLKRLSSPATARSGNVIAASGMALAIAVTLLDRAIVQLTTILLGIGLGSVIGVVLAYTIRMTAMPQMVALLNGFGGGASALVAGAAFLRLADGAQAPIDVAVSIVASVGIGAVTFSGSLIAFGKLQGLVERPITYPLQSVINGLLLISIVVVGSWAVGDPTRPGLFEVAAALALLLGVLLVLPIGGADMPVVISFLNSTSGLAAASTGFVVSNYGLIIGGALVGASGMILTLSMCRAMNRSIANVLFGAFGGGDAAAGAAGSGDTVRRIGAEDTAILLAYARSVIFVPGYGLAVSRAHHELQELTVLLEERGVDVKYAIHPVAGRMPGHMNVLLAEAEVPYEELFDMSQINPHFERTDVALVVGANDVVNPAAREDPNSPIYGMPILNVGQAANVIVIKRTLGPGFAGIPNALFYAANTSMFLDEAKHAIGQLVEAVKGL